MNKIRRFPLSQSTSLPVSGLGLLSDEPDYRLCWLFNQSFSWDLIRTKDIVDTDKNSPVFQSFPCFASNSGHQPTIKLVGNRSKEGLWLTVFEQVDYLLVVCDPDPAEVYLNELKSTITTKIPQIRGLFKVPLPSFCYL